MCFMFCSLDGKDFPSSKFENGSAELVSFQFLLALLLFTGSLATPQRRILEQKTCGEEKDRAQSHVLSIL